MKLIWTKSNLPYSILIRKLTGQDCSHFAIVFESPAGGLMFESNLLGTHPKFFSNAKKHFEVVHQLDLDLSTEIEDKVWDEVVDKFDGKPYDFGGALYLGIRILLERVFKIKRPTVNRWASSEKFYCDEIYDCLKAISDLPPLDENGGMDTPFEVYLKISEKWCK